MAYVNNPFGDSTGGMALNVTSPSSPAWVLDFGVINHMTDNSSLFSSYIFGSGQKKVTVADGSQSTIARKEVVQLIDNLTLHSTLHVPDMSLNLLSIGTITEDLNCAVTFFLIIVSFKICK